MSVQSGLPAPMTDAELMEVCLTWTDGDHDAAKILVSMYRAGERLANQLDRYEAAGLGRGLKEVEANIGRRMARGN